MKSLGTSWLGTGAAVLIFIGSIIAIILILRNSYIIGTKGSGSKGQYNMKESFKSIPFRPQIEGPYGLGFANKYEPIPLQVNFVPKLLGSDFKLAGFIRKLKMNSNNNTISNGSKRMIIGNRDNKNIGIGPQKNPILFVPDIGASSVYVKWSKIDADAVKKVDAYGQFQESTGWSCKDTETEFVKLWFPKDTEGLSRYCWQDLVKTTVNNNGTISNLPGTMTKPSQDSSMNFESDIYNTLIEMLYADSYVENSTLFGANYDHRLIFSPDVFLDWAISFRNMIESSVITNGRLAILMGHGLGAVIINIFLNGQSTQWKKEYVACFISISGSFGSVPKALRVLLSGDSLPDSSDQDLIRTGLFGSSGLLNMIPDQFDNNQEQGPIVTHNNKTYNTRTIKDLVEYAAKNLNTSEDSISKAYDISKTLKNMSLQPPNVTMHVLTGSDIDTESSYVYDDILSNPVNIQYSNGDGTVPKECLDIPDTWTTKQSDPITHKIYTRTEHSMEIKKIQIF